MPVDRLLGRLRVSNGSQETGLIEEREPVFVELTAAAAQEHRNDKERRKLIVELGLSSVVPNASILRRFAEGTFGEMDLVESVAAMSEKVNAITGGNLDALATTLAAQASALEMIFSALAKRAADNIDCLKTTEAYLRLALKAQAQCRATLQTLFEVKNPQPVAFFKQGNFANGPQQINNGPSAGVPLAHAPARNSTHASNELLEGGYGARLDTGTKGAAAGADRRLEAVGSLHWTENN
jgi:hypothetical protein